jgi:hypothetical protein
MLETAEQEKAALRAPLASKPAVPELSAQAQESYQQFLDETKDATRPYARGALIACIAECQALSYSEDRGITVSEAESIGGVLHELRRLQNLEAEAVAVVTRESATPTAPEGWKLVPVELNADMLAALRAPVGSTEQRYRAMLAASPTAPAQSCGDAEQADEAVTDDVFGWLETEVTAISCRYHGDPSYDHDAYWMRDRVVKLIGEARNTFAARTKDSK